MGYCSVRQSAVTGVKADVGSEDVQYELTSLRKARCLPIGIGTAQTLVFATGAFTLTWLILFVTLDKKKCESHKYLHNSGFKALTRALACMQLVHARARGRPWAFSNVNSP